MATRNQRRKASRARRDAKAIKLNAIAMHVLKRAVVSRNLANPVRPERSGSLASHLDPRRMARRMELINS